MFDRCQSQLYSVVRNSASPKNDPSNRRHSSSSRKLANLIADSNRDPAPKEPKYITSAALSELISDPLKSEYDHVVILDCRYPHEYKGGRILGAQCIGFGGVEKRIDVLATALRAGLRATDLKDLDLAYAPPYSSAKDPVNMAGYMAENLALGRVKQAYCEDVAALPRDGSATLLDTRTPFEYARGHAAGFVNIPLDELRGRLGEIARERPVYVMCQSGLRSYLACRILAQNGYDCYNIAGGYRFYAANLCE